MYYMYYIYYIFDTVLHDINLLMINTEILHILQVVTVGADTNGTTMTLNITPNVTHHDIKHNTPMASSP